MLEKGRVYEIRIEDMGQNGEGIGRAEGIAVFAEGAVWGDLCRVEITGMKKSYALGRVREIIEPSVYRQEPKCAFVGRCGGCSLGLLRYEGQLCLKERQVREHLIRIGGVKEPPVLPILGMEEPFHYRNHGQFPIGGSSSRPAVGFYQKRSHEIVDCPCCLLQSAPAVAAAEGVRAYIRETGVSLYDERTGKGCLRHLVVRNAEGTGEVMVILVVNQGRLPASELLLEKVEEALDALEEMEGGKRWTLRCLGVNFNKGKGRRALGEKTVFLYGQERIQDVFEGLSYLISPESFYQINTPQTRKLYGVVKDFAALTGEETVFDLYCGVGTIGLYLAREAKQVVGIEAVQKAVYDANRGAIKNGTVNALFRWGKAESLLPELVEKGSRADVAILDPPRSGCDRRLLEAVARAEVKRAVYVSCNPATLARDVKILGELGYRLEAVQPVDLFPWTVHVETVVLLSKLNTKQHIEVELNLDELDLTAAESKATYDEIKAYVLEKHGLKVSSLYISQVKRKCGLDVGQNYNLSKKEDAKVPQCPPDKEAAIMEALKHFQMI